MHCTSREFPEARIENIIRMLHFKYAPLLSRLQLARDLRSSTVRRMLRA